MEGFVAKAKHCQKNYVALPLFLSKHLKMAKWKILFKFSLTFKE
jgi:hypothetical protein